ncbi:Mechanosensitive ion channel [Pseudomonas pohangensis]|uniref:Small-conductance mechanosensitive channel n=1 Tax=Pseudomonas pohangensis TaxID=364197 RepID=A0A1H2ENW9_9PSED|nr:mechanosensitive ion channel domain-containing protein [Pseudomonas pohangensis]SDT96862.1 Mechanosensitive ion channel [Pseudomonas pohangensis]
MLDMGKLQPFVLDMLPFLGVCLGVFLLLGLSHWLLLARHPDMGNEKRFPRQLILLGATLAGLLLILLVMPIDQGTRGQVIGLLGLLISGLLAFSSTNVLGNLMSGLLLRMTKPFRLGDFIRVGEHFGRVSERGLFDTEIQTENRELVALPNTYLISNPVTTIRSSGTIVSTELSLGFDVHHAQIEPLLLQAASASGLQDAFVHVLEIGNFAVTYRIAGFLEDPKHLLTARSDLCRQVLDALHGQDIEILSPTYMVQRPLEATARVIPPPVCAATADKTAAETTEAPEELLFDKAEQAEKLSAERKALRASIEEMQANLKAAAADARAQIKAGIEEAQAQLQALEQARPDEEEQSAGLY